MPSRKEDDIEQVNTFDERLREILKDKTNRVFLFGFFAVIFAMIVWAIVSAYKRDRQAADFIKRDIHGVLTGIRDDHHGEFTLTIRQYGTNEVLEYYLFVSKFIRDNNIQELDSISKSANSHIIEFHKKKEGRFYKCCNLYYH